MDYSFFDSAYDGVLVVDKNGKIIYCNDAAAVICDSSVKRLAGKKSLKDVVIFGRPQEFDESPKPWTEMDFRLVGKEKVGKIQLSVQPFKDADEMLWVLTLHDVTLEETLHRKYQGELEQKEDVILQLKKAQSQLEAYSKDLEKMVAERTEALSSANQMLSAIMDSLGQGFLVFNQEGICSNVFTKACLTILESAPAQRPIWEVLKLSGEEQDQFKMWLKASFSESLPFESLKDLAPQNYQHSEGRFITLDYFPIRNAEGAFLNMVLVATDRTIEYQANLALEKERKYVEMILKLITNREQFAKFLDSAKETIAQCFKLTQAADEFNKDQMFRVLHTLEGEAGAFSVEPLRLACRSSQHLLNEFETEVRADSLKKLQHSLGELRVSYEDFLSENAKLFKAINLGGARAYEFSEVELQAYFDLLTEHHASRDLVNAFESRFLRLPVTPLLKHFDELVANVASKLGKKIEPLRFNCSDVRVTPRLVEPVFASLVHAFRNAVDHGIEAPEEREMLGKNPVGHIEIKAEYINGDQWMRLEITDDGGGINSEMVAKKAREKIPDLKIDTMTESEILQLVFHPGFSSKEAVGEFSGRGVGMDAIRYEVLQLGGKVWVESTLGQGSKLSLEIPVTPAKPHIAKSA